MVKAHASLLKSATIPPLNSFFKGRCGLQVCDFCLVGIQNVLIAASKSMTSHQLVPSPNGTD